MIVNFESNDTLSSIGSIVLKSALQTLHWYTPEKSGGKRFVASSSRPATIIFWTIRQHWNYSIWLTVLFRCVSKHSLRNGEAQVSEALSVKNYTIPYTEHILNYTGSIFGRVRFTIGSLSELLNVYSVQLTPHSTRPSTQNRQKVEPLRSNCLP